jgi:hypothetical protein
LWSASLAIRVLAMNPAPPVMKMVLPWIMGSSMLPVGGSTSGRL